MSHRHHPRRPIHRRTKEITVPLLGYTCMQSHPDTDPSLSRPSLASQGGLRGQGSGDSFFSPPKGRRERVAPSGEHIAIIRLDRRSQNRVVKFER
jgi:hypothetical protein